MVFSSDDYWVRSIMPIISTKIKVPGASSQWKTAPAAVKDTIQ